MGRAKELSKRLYGRCNNREEQPSEYKKEKLPMDTIRAQVLKERDEELLNKFEQRKIQQMSLRQSMKQFQSSQRVGPISKSTFDLQVVAASSVHTDTKTARPTPGVEEPRLIDQPSQSNIRSQIANEQSMTSLVSNNA